METRRFGRTDLEIPVVTFGGGWVGALRDSGTKAVETEILDDRPGFYQGYYGAQNLLSRCPDLDAIYFQNDEMAVGGMAFCQSVGLGIPSDIGIAGWGGMEVGGAESGHAASAMW